MDIKLLKEYNEFETIGLLLLDEVNSIVITTSIELSIASDFQVKARTARTNLEKKRTELVKPYNDFVKQINEKAKEILIPIEQAELQIKNKILTYQIEEQKRKEEAEKKVQEQISFVKNTTTEDELQSLIVSFGEDIDNRINTAVEVQMLEFENRRKRAEEEKLRKEEEERLKKIALEQSAEQAKLEQQRIDNERQMREIEEQKRKLEQEKLQQETTIEKKTTVSVKGQRMVKKFEVLDENKVPRLLCSPDEKKIRAFVVAGAKEIEGVKIREEAVIY